MAQNHVRLKGQAAPGSRPAGSSAYPQGGQHHMTLRGGPIKKGTAADVGRGSSTTNSQPS